MILIILEIWSTILNIALHSRCLICLTNIIHYKRNSGPKVKPTPTYYHNSNCNLPLALRQTLTTHQPNLAQLTDFVRNNSIISTKCKSGYYWCRNNTIMGSSCPRCSYNIHLMPSQSKFWLCLKKVCDRTKEKLQKGKYGITLLRFTSR